MKKYYANGELAMQQKGNNLTYYYKDGKVRAKGKSIKGKMEGKWIFYRATGQLWEIGHFKNNQKHGAWIRYDRKDKVEYDEKFINGKIKR